MEQETTNHEEVTLKEVILKAKEFFWEIVKNWKILFLIILPIVAISFYLAYSAPVEYSSELTFMVNDDDEVSGGLGGLAASLGFGGGGGGDYNLAKILSLLKSRNIIEQALFEKQTIEGKEDFFANHIIELYEYDERWEKGDKEDLIDFRFSTDSVNNFGLVENRILKQLHSHLVGNKDSGVKGILIGSVDDFTGIMTIRVSTVHEDLSIEFVKTLFEKLRKFYVDKTVEKQETTYKIVREKVDSLRDGLNSIQFQLLKFKDSQRNLLLRQYEAKVARLETQSRIMGVAYAEAVKNKEAADFTLKTKTPFIQTIDTPIPPLQPSKNTNTYIKSIIIGFLLGLFCAVFFIIVRKVLRDIMN